MQYSSSLLDAFSNNGREKAKQSKKAVASKREAAKQGSQPLSKQSKAGRLLCLATVPLTTTTIGERGGTGLRYTVVSKTIT